MKEKEKGFPKNHNMFFKNLLLILLMLCCGMVLKAQDTTICSAYFTVSNDSANLNTVFMNNHSWGKNLMYWWDFGDGTTSSLKNPAHTYANKGNYTVCLTVTSAADTACHRIWCENFSVGPCNAMFAANDSLGVMHFFNYSSGNIVNYFWDFGDGTTSTDKNPPPHNYNAPGAHVVCLTVSSADSSCSSTHCDTVKSLNCYASFICQKDSLGNGVNFNVTNTNNLNNYFWNFGDGTTSTQINPYHIYATDGSYTACLTVSNADSSCYDTYCMVISINTGRCSAGFYTSDTLGGILIHNTSTGNTTNYLWDFGDGTTSNNEHPGLHFYPASGAYTICLFVSNPATSCADTLCRTIIISGCNSNYTYKTDTAGNGVTFKPSVISNDYKYSWDFGDGNTSTQMKPYHVYKSNGSYYVCLTVSSVADSACNSKSCTKIGLYALCDAKFKIFRDTVNLQHISVYNYSTANHFTYLWNFGDGTTSDLPSPSHTYANGGKYTICLTVTSSTDSTCNVKSCENIVIKDLKCDAGFIIVKDTVNNNNIYIYNNSKGKAPVSYLWNFGDGSTSTLENPVHTYVNNGTYQLCLTITDKKGCTDTFCDSIYAGRSGEVTITVINAAALNIKNVVITKTSLENYPNPFIQATTINYSIPANAVVDLYVMDLLGNKIKTIEHANKMKGAYVSEWKPGNIASGIYLLQLKANNQVITKKIIVNK